MTVWESYCHALEKGCLVEVTDWRDASRLVLDTTYDHFREAPSSVGDHVLGWMTGDIQKGVQSTEQGRKHMFPKTVAYIIYFVYCKVPRIQNCLLCVPSARGLRLG